MYMTDLVVISPNMAGLFQCHDCHMRFNSQALLAKHKQKFCVGSTGDPNDLQLRRGFRSTSPPRLISPDDRGKTDNQKTKTPLQEKQEQDDESVVLEEKDDYRKNPNQDQQLRNLAESHGRQMEYLQLRNKDLEKQREDIRKKLEGLGRRSVPPVHDNTQDLLWELRQQELRNQRNIDDLKNELRNMNNQKLNVIEIEKPVYPQPPPPQPPPPNPPSPEPKRNFVMPIFYGKSLVAEIIAIRQAYLQNGGNDPEVLAQMAQMQAEAQAIEDQMNKEPEKRPKEKPKDSSGQLSYLELENERLIRELNLLQDQNLLAQQRKKSDKEDELERELRRLQREHLDKMYGLQKELDDLRILLMMERNRPPQQAPPPTTIVHQQPQPAVSLKPYVEVEPMAPYDQYMVVRDGSPCRHFVSPYPYPYAYWARKVIRWA